MLKLIETVDSERERLAWIVDLHLGMTSRRTNETMQLLTLVSTIFLPLTFVVGIYGMNFEHMPELAWFWGYPGVMVAMAVLAAGIVAWYRSRGWL